MAKSGADRQREYRERQREENARRIDVLVSSTASHEFRHLQKTTGLPTGELLEVIIKVAANLELDRQAGKKGYNELADVLKKRQAEKADPRQGEIEG